ncbi:hypothetical protein [Rhizobium johnstonii]|uniref:hypothetical protein n=1 Tax=Rhizobium johnstonii TaxID=3019933 RepID=UPI003F9D0D13
MKTWKIPQLRVGGLSIYEVNKLSHLGRPTSPEIPRPDFVKSDAWTFLVPLAEHAWTVAGRPMFRNAFQVEAFIASVVVAVPGFESYGFANQQACKEVSLHLRNLRNYIARDHGTEFHEATRCYSVPLASQSPLPRSKSFHVYFRRRAAQYLRRHAYHLEELKIAGAAARDTSRFAPVDPDGRAIFNMSAEDLSDQIGNLTDRYLRFSFKDANLMGVPPEGLLWRSTLRLFDPSEAETDQFALQALADYRSAWEDLSAPRRNLMLMSKSYWRPFLSRRSLSGTEGRPEVTPAIFSSSTLRFVSLRNSCQRTPRSQASGEI